MRSSPVSGESTAAALARKAARVREAAEVAQGRAGVRVTIGNAPGYGQAFDRVFTALDDALASLPEIMRDEALPQVRAELRRNFLTEGANTGRRWAALKPSTQRERARRGYGPAHPILRRRGVLMREVVGARSSVRSGGGAVELRISPDRTVRFVALSLGTSNMEARPMMALSTPAANRVASRISRALRARAGV